MAKLVCNFISYALKRTVDITVVLPSVTIPEAMQLPMPGKENPVPPTHEVKEKYPVLYLLHGMGNNHAQWTGYTNVELFAEERNMAVVMISGENKFYHDSLDGEPFFDFVAKEVPEFVTNYFPISAEPEHSYIAGLSMGGYGALLHGLSNPERFAAIGSFSGAVMPVGDPEKVEGLIDGPLDVKWLVKKAIADGKKIPPLYVTCGEEDMLYEINTEFKDYLKEEGITPSDEIIELDFPTQPNLPTKKLKTLALKDGYKDNQKLGFKRTHYPWLYEIPAEFDGKIKTPHIALDLYPRLEAISTTEGSAALQLNVRYEGKLNQAHFALFDFDRIYLALQAFKQQRSWSNLRLDKQRLIDFCLADQSWYTLYMPKPEFEARSFADIKRLEDILIRLLCDYTDRFYKALKTGYEGQFYEVIPMHDEHGSMLKLYHFEIDDSDDGHEYLKKLEVLKALVAKGDLGEASKWNAPHMVAISFDRHLFYPLLSLEDKDAVPLKMRPLAFDAPSEIQFIEDLQAFYGSPIGRDAIGARSLYLLRNADSKNKGIGFATAGNFYPDFLLWLVDDASGEQWLSFVDPKGLKHMDLNHPKLGLYTEIKKIEADLTRQASTGEPALTLNAFVLSPTKYADLLNVGDKVKKQELEDKHVLFMEDGANSYLKKMFDRIN